MIPSCGGIGFLGALIPKTFLRNWLNTNSPVPTKDLKNSGFIHDFYTDSNEVLKMEMLKKIHSFPPVTRTQLKSSLLEPILPELEKTPKSAHRSG